MSLDAYLFCRANGAGGLGHVGYGFAQANGRFVCGSTENIKGDAAIANGEPNYHWYCEVASEQAMFAEMKKNHFANLLKPNDHNHYDMCKRVACARPNPAAALRIAQSLDQAGYGLVGNNCLDHATAVLEAFGLGWHPTGAMPWKQTNTGPNGYWLAFPGEAIHLHQ